MIYLFSIFTFFLQGLFSLLLPFSLSSLSFLSCDFVLITLIFVGICFIRKKEKTRYYIFSILYGFCYDLVYTNVLVIDSVLFLLVALFVVWFYDKFENNYLNLIFIFIGVMLFYHTLFYLLSILFTGSIFLFYEPFYRVLDGLVINVLFFTFFYFLFFKKTRFK